AVVRIPERALAEARDGDAPDLPPMVELLPVTEAARVPRDQRRRVREQREQRAPAPRRNARSKIGRQSGGILLGGRGGVPNPAVERRRLVVRRIRPPRTQADVR